MKHNLRSDVWEIFDAGLKAADPNEAVKRAIKLDESGLLVVGAREYELSQFDRILVVGAGKAAAPMALALENLLGPRISKGAVTTKYGHGLSLKIISLTEAGHPLPD